tara:strand:+ start:98 stop:628 length:531 start_codon:yes stop_codon:yes gene_type:complete
MNNNILWDFDEKKNYIKHFVDGNEYLVLKNKDYVDAAILLHRIAIITLKLFINIEMNSKRDKFLDLLITTPHFFQEMQLEKDQKQIIFIGLNKPKKIKYVKDSVPIGTDNKYRASHRVIFLTLRDSKNKLKPLSKIIPLLAHELTHTAMNHLTFKEDNHDETFKKYNRIILNYLKD